MAAKPKKLILIDGHSLLNRAYFALPTLTTQSGVHTNAVYGFTLMLTRLLADEEPDSVAVAFDMSAPTFRHEAYKEYKAHRPSMHDELRSQLPLAKEILAAYRIPIFELPGYEADDVIGTLATLAAGKGVQVLIVTGDKDALQLVEERVKVLLTRKGIKEVETFDTQRVQEYLGVAPARVVDLKGLMGDASDNIPGVPGIGEKTALKLLREYGSIESLLEHKEEVKGKIGESLRRHWEDAVLSKRLATIDRDVPIEVDWDALRRSEPDYERLAQIFMELEFVRCSSRSGSGRAGCRSQSRRGLPGRIGTVRSLLSLMTRPLKTRWKCSGRKNRSGSWSSGRVRRRSMHNSSALRSRPTDAFFTFRSAIDEALTCRRRRSLAPCAIC